MRPILYIIIYSICNYSMRILIPSRDILFFFVQAAANFPQSFYIGFDLCSWIQLPVKNTTAMEEKHIYWDLFTRISYTYIFYVVSFFAILPPSRWISFSKNNLLYLYELLLNYCSFMRGSGWFSQLGCGGVNILCGFILKFQFFFGRGGGGSDLKIFARSSHEPTSLTKWHYVTK